AAQPLSSAAVRNGKSKSPFFIFTLLLMLLLTSLGESAEEGEKAGGPHRKMRCQPAEALVVRGFRVH
ncbi:MAG: hypothetical protein ABN478_14465, partial [Mixta sp.]